MMFGRNSGKLIQLGALAVVCPLVCAAGPQPLAENISIHLRVDAGTPLRLYITKRASYRQGEPVQAKFAEPVWAFDRIVIPAGTGVDGRIVQLEPVSKMARAMAIVRGDFTPLKQAEVSFTRMVLPDGRSMALDVQPSLGLASIYDPAMAG